MSKDNQALYARGNSFRVVKLLRGVFADGGVKSGGSKAKNFIAESRLKVVCKRYDIARPAYVHSSHFACPLIGGAGRLGTRHNHHTRERNSTV